MPSRLISFLIMLALAGCGTLPHPFEGNPGGIAMRLAVPPPARLAVPTPTQALLGAPAASLLAGDVAASLLAQEVPAVHQPARRGDWGLRIDAASRGDMVQPSYSVLTPSGAVRGTVDGAPVRQLDWEAGNAATLQQVANDAGPRLADLLTGIQAAQMQSDPNSLMNRPARIYFTGVAGAPGDGDLSLARQMAVSLPDGGNLLQNSRSNADFTLGGTVKVTHLNPRTDHVEIVWTVRGADGAVAGKVAQLNDIPSHTLDTYWGDVAVVVAREAAGGVREVITNNSGRHHKPHAPPAKGRA